MSKKLNCYDCKFRGRVPGSAHSSCKHPAVTGEKEDPLAELFALGGYPVGILMDAAVKLDIQANAHGVRSGWFAWPYNFDPVWLENCNGFEAREVSKDEVV